MTLAFELDLDSVKANHHVVQKLSSGLTQTHTDTYTQPTALLEPLKSFNKKTTAKLLRKSNWKENHANCYKVFCVSHATSRRLRSCLLQQAAAAAAENDRR